MGMEDKDVGKSKQAIEDNFKKIEEQVKQEVKDGKVSVEYEMRWKPKTVQKVYSGSERYNEKKDYALLGLNLEDGKMVLSKIREIVDMKNTYEKDTVELANTLINNIKNWKPENIYSTYRQRYDIKEGSTKTTVDEYLSPAFKDYQEFADDFNKIRGTPIRTIYYRTLFYPDGKSTLEMFWGVHLSYNIKGETYRKLEEHYNREYQLTPEFKFIRGTKIINIKEEIEAEKKKEEENKEKKEKKIQKKEKKEDKKNKKQLKDIENNIYFMIQSGVHYYVVKKYDFKESFNKTKLINEIVKKMKPYFDENEAEYGNVDQENEIKKVIEDWIKNNGDKLYPK